MEDKPNIEFFDVERYLNTKGIPFITEGKNIQSGWIGIACPWCDDPSNHLGIDLSTKGINCFRCPVRGTVIRLIMKIDHLPPDLAIAELKKFSAYDLSSFEKESPERQGRLGEPHVILASASQKTLESYHRQYLESRNFDPEYLTKKYQLQFTGPLGDYRMRIITPIYMQRQLLSFTTRDVTGLAKIPWVHGAPHRVILSPKNCLYNIDTVTDTAIVVEGASDVWRIGDGAVATFGHKYTKKQVYLLRNFRRVFVLFDTEEEAQRDARRLAYDLSSFVPDVHVFELDSGDPGDLSEDDVKAIRTEIFGRKF